MITEICNLYSEIVRNQEKTKQIKGVVKYPQRGEDIPFNLTLCNAYGAKIGHSTIVEANEGAHRFCPVSHTVVAPEDLFCNHRGAKIVDS